MPAIDKIDMSGTVVGERQVSDGLIEEKVNTGLLHEVIRAEELQPAAGRRLPRAEAWLEPQGPSPGVRRASVGPAQAPPACLSGLVVEWFFRQCRVTSLSR